MAIEGFRFVVYPASPRKRSAAAKWFRDAVDDVGLDEAELVVLPHAARWWRAASKLILAGGAVLTHPRFKDASDDPAWAMLLSYIQYTKRAGVVGSVPPWPFGTEGRSQTWDWLSGFLEQLVVSADTESCFVNGEGAGDDAERLPSESELASGLPGAVTAWNYFGPTRLALHDAERLARLPAFESRPLGKGWLLRPVADYEDDPPPDFVAAYSSVAGKEIQFLRAPLDIPRRERKRPGGSDH